MTTIRSSFSIAFFMSGRRVCEFGAWPQNTIALMLSDWATLALSSSTPSIPAAHRDARLGHDGLVLEAAHQIVVADVPDAGPVLPGSFREAVVAGQGVHQNAEVGGALHVVVAAEDVGAAAGHADVAQRELQDAVGAGVVVAVGVLGAAHAPDDGARLVGCHRAGDAAQLGAGHAGDALGFPQASISSLPRG